MYVRNAALFHRPSARMVESSRPAFAAAVAAPMRKLWPAKCWYGRPTAIRASLTNDMKYDFVSGIPFSLMKSGLADAPLFAMYVRVEATGQRGSLARPTKTSTPLPSWSHLDRFK